MRKQNERKEEEKNAHSFYVALRIRVLPFFFLSSLACLNKNCSEEIRRKANKNAEDVF